MNFTCVGVCGVEGRGKSISREFSFNCEKENQEESSTKSLGGTTRPDDKVGFSNWSCDHSCQSWPGLDRTSRSIASRVLRVGQLLHLRKGRSFPVIYGTKGDPLT